MKKVAIIGAGLGGLSSAINLAVNGYIVDVYEKNLSVGGKAGEIKKSGFRFDSGPSLLTMPFVLSKIFDSANENIQDYIKLKKLDISCKYFYPDGTVINSYSDVEKLGVEIENNTTDSRDSLNRFLLYCKNIYDLTAEIFLFTSFKDFNSLFKQKGFNTLLHIFRIDPFRTMHKSISRYFNDDKTIQFFDRYATYNGSNPFLAPATLNIISHVEHNLGAYIPIDGIHSISLGLKNLAIKKGVNINFCSEVQKILIKNKEVIGIRVNETDKFYDIVVCNSDINYTFENLLEDNLLDKAVKKYEPSSSAIVFYWGISGVHNQLDIHNILFSSNYKKEFDDIFNNHTCPEGPTVYIYISSKYKKDDAPVESENWFVMVNAPYNKGQNWNDEIRKTRTAVLKKINETLKINLEDKIVFEEILSPVEIENNTLSKFGSIYGMSSNNRNAAFLRQYNKSRHYKHLYFCGGTVHPGGGIPLVLLSGNIAADLVRRNENNND
jgi:phytoene desaturase